MPFEDKEGCPNIVTQNKSERPCRAERPFYGVFFCCEKNHAFREKCAKLKSMQRYLRPGGKLILREVTSDNKLLLWFMDKIELPLANLCGHGDVTIATREVVTDCCKKAGLKVEKLEIRKGMRMHCVVRK